MSINIFRPIRLGKEVFHPKSYDENSFVMDWSIESGGKVPSHAHMHANEHFRITSGEITFVLNGEKTIEEVG
jgi:quercetin dioxygenase-like cupin family protein